MRLKPKSQEHSSEDKKCVQITEFKYSEGIKSRRKKQNIQIVQSQPLKILAHKLSLASESNASNRMNNKKQHVSDQIKPMDYIQEIKKMMTPRDALFQPRRSIFNRYNYQTYNNYQYKNPFKPKRYPIDDKMQQPLKNNPTKGSDKNLEIVYCEHRYTSFVEKSNSYFRQFYETSRDFPIVKSPKKNSNPKLQRHESESKAFAKTSYRLNKRKTTLSSYLQEFTTLEKLSEYMERQQKLNQKYLLQSAGDLSRTVLLEVVIHRFDFLKKMKKKGRELIFRILLGEQSRQPMFKINIQDYIKLIQIFVSRDAEPPFLSMFIFRFLFKDEESVNMMCALDSLDLIDSSVNRHKVVEGRLQKILYSCSGKPQQVYQGIKQDQVLQNAFIDLITLI